MAAPIHPGSTLRCNCEDCGAEFEVTYEPKAKTKEEQSAIKTAQVTHCPLCGSEDIKTDADE